MILHSDLLSSAVRKATVVACVGTVGMLGGAAYASGPSYTPIAIVPTPDVYATLSQHPELAPIFPKRVTGQYSRMLVIGDSYADFGNSRRAYTTSAGTIAGFTRADGVFVPFTGVNGPQTFVNADNGRFGNLLNPVDFLQYHYGMATSQVSNYAVGGAGGGTLNNQGTPGSTDYVLLPGMQQEVDEIVKAGFRFGAADLINVTTAGGNDAFMGVPVATNAVSVFNDIRRLVALGAQNVLVTGPGFADYTAAQKAALVPFATAGVRLFYFDMNALQAQIRANPAAYGFTNATAACRPSTLSSSGGATCGSSNTDYAGQDKYFSWDGVHLTTAGYAWLAAYEANQVDAPATIAAQGELGQVAASTYSDMLFSRLAASRGLGGSDAVTGSAIPLAIFAEGGYQAGKRSDRLFAYGYDYSIPGGMAGAEYRFGPNLLAGAAFRYSQPRATLHQEAGHVDGTSYQFAAFGSLIYPDWFADLVMGYGWQQYKLDRPGVLDTINGKTHGAGMLAGVKGGYLFDVATLKAGPIGGLSYSSAEVAAYTETGDPLLTQSVNSQKVNALTGSIGGQVRFGGLLGSASLDPYLNVTVEHEFQGGNRSIVTAQTSASMLPVTTPITGRGRITYGKLAAGVNGALASGLTAHINGSTTFARDGGNDYGVMASAKYRF